jgi:hypothetical protein
VWRTYGDNFCDKMHAYIEECEHCQSIFDCVDGFSGMAAKCLMEHLVEEYGKPVFSAPLIPPKVLLFKNSDAPMTDSIRLVNIAISFVHLNEFSALFLKNYVSTTLLEHFLHNLQQFLFKSVY